MIDLTKVAHHPAIEEIVDVICTKTQNTDRGLFRIEVAYFLAKMAAGMRAKVKTKDRGEIPINVYALALATSGSGKGFSVGIIENQFMRGFKQRFMDDTFTVIAEKHLMNQASKRAARNGTQDAEELERVEKEFKQCGPLAFTFDSGTTAAIKQMRQKLLLANCGSINLQIDEIGSNLLGSVDILTAFLELYDQGEIKQKLTKNTNENQRGEELDGKTPANALLFGTPSKLLDGGQTEDQFYTMLETGYARRCLFAFGHRHRAGQDLTPEELYAKSIEPQNDVAIAKWFNHFVDLADPTKFDWTADVPDLVAIELLRYKIDCERLADLLPEHEEIQKSELTHRYFKALKLAGTFAFIDESIEVQLDHLYAAIKLVEESGIAFQLILNREKTYVKLAKFIAASKTELTHADMNEKLPFYGTSSGRRTELLTLATAWGYRNRIIIKKTHLDGIEFFTGETLEETDLDKLIVSYSDDFAYKYLHERVSFQNLEVITKAPGYHWCNHAFENNHRSEETALQGFNMIVIDVDGGTPIHTVHDLLSDYTFMTYTTKRHTELEHRFRIILPINYRLMMDKDEYKEFMKSFSTWLPFQIDDQANQRSRKWLTNPDATVHYNQGKLIDALKFVPKTSKNEAYNREYQELVSLDNLERWFAGRMAEGNRNNNMAAYAFALYDTGMTYPEIEDKVLNFNKQLPNRLTEDELRSTVLVSVSKKFTR